MPAESYAWSIDVQKCINSKLGEVGVEVFRMKMWPLSREQLVDLLWPDLQDIKPCQVSASLQLDGQSWQVIARDGLPVAWYQDDQPAARPGLPDIQPPGRPVPYLDCRPDYRSNNLHRAG